MKRKGRKKNPGPLLSASREGANWCLGHGACAQVPREQQTQ